MTDCDHARHNVFSGGGVIPTGRYGTVGPPSGDPLSHWKPCPARGTPALPPSVAQEAPDGAPGATGRAEAQTGSEVLWRTGRKVGRTIYRGNSLVGVMDTPWLATLVVGALNATEGRHTGEGGVQSEQPDRVALRPDHRDDDLLDDVFVRDVSMFRAEMMSDKLLSLSCYLPGTGERNDRIAFDVFAKKGKLHFYHVDGPEGAVKFEGER